jgi:CpeT protein
MFTLFFACTATNPVVDSTADTAPVFDGVALLSERLSGRFDSADQAEADPSYYAVSLLGCPVDAPELGEHVLYIEQALTTNLAAPYRQRLYVLSESDGVYVSAIYTLANEGAAIGLCDRATATFSSGEATLKSGCEVKLTWDGEHFEGGTDLGTCASTLNGASYATSEVLITEDRIESWDRGYDDGDDQIWGATAGAYIFVRR